jgi:hypothetical protein
MGAVCLICATMQVDLGYAVIVVSSAATVPHLVKSSARPRRQGSERFGHFDRRAFRRPADPTSGQTRSPNHRVTSGDRPWRIAGDGSPFLNSVMRYNFTKIYRKFSNPHRDDPIAIVLYNMI